LFENARVLVVDDQLPNVRLLERHLQQAHCTQVKTTTNPLCVVDLVSAFGPDLILLDLMMPELDGFGVMEQLRGVVPSDAYLPILILTADISAENKRRALAAGARDFLTKPFDATEALLRMQNLLEPRSLHRQLKDQNHQLEERVAQRTAQLQESQFEVLQRLARAAEYRDDDTGQHTNRVGGFAAELARRMGMDSTQVDLIHAAAPLHDVGKIGISDSILLKPGRLTPEEFATMKAHASIGANLLSGGQSELVKLAEIIAGTHHERWDGSGYPQGLRGEEIPLCGRIVALADVFDALSNERPYKPAWPLSEVVAEIRGQSGRQFDPQLVSIFLEMVNSGVDKT
jgi:putative two-component system response regulator